MEGEKEKISCDLVKGLFSPKLFECLATVAGKMPSGIYLAGGTVRDLILGKHPVDVDLTVACHARKWATELVRLSGGSYVPLGREEDAARVVRGDEVLDFSSFRDGATSIAQEMTKRDLTINGLGVCIDSLLTGKGCEALSVIDPLGGVQDLADGRIRVCSRSSFMEDPLRMLRVFRFAATLDFFIQPETLEAIRQQRERIASVAAERIAHELDLIMASHKAHSAFVQMAETGLLFAVLPELRSGVGMEQPASHHLDVFEHLLETLYQMEQIQRHPGASFPANSTIMESWLAKGHRPRLLKWAALFHDVGKPATYGINEDKGGRITFYNHDQQGAEVFRSIAARLHWSKDDTTFVASLIATHMRPFFLANNQRQDGLTLKACLRLIKAVGDRLPGLFLLAMADALAGKGEKSPKAIEAEVAAVFERLQQVQEEHVTPVQTSAPLLTGQDLIEVLQLEPGPVFRQIFELVEEARMEHRVRTRTEALALAVEYVRRQKG